MGLIAPTLIVSCTNEDFIENASNNATNSDMFDVSELNFVVGKGKDIASRAIWDKVEDGDNVSYKFKWEKAKVLQDAIGIAYVGTVDGTSAVTNYKFEVDSLGLADGYIAKADNEDQRYGFYHISQDAEDVNVLYTKGTAGEYLDTDLATSDKAKFKTVNDQIMRGYYVGYYPFDASFTDPGYIKVKTAKRLDLDTQETSLSKIEEVNLQAVGNNSFAYTSPTKLEPGSQVTYMEMKQLTSMLRLQINSELDAVKDIRTVIIRTRDNDLFSVAGTLKNPSAAPSAENVNVTEKTSTLVVAYPFTNQTTNCCLPIPAKNGQADGVANVYFPVLPSTFNGGFDIILIGEDGKACVINKDFKNSTATFESGKAYVLSVDLTSDVKFDKSFVTSQAELEEALTAAKTSQTPFTIELLGDVETENLEFEHSDPSGKDVTITASAGSKLVLKSSSIKLTNTLDTDGKPNGHKLIINAPTEVENLKMYGIVEFNSDVTFKGVNNNIGTTTANNDGDTDFWGQLYINGNASVVKDAKLNAVNSWGVFVGKDATLTISKDAEYNNNVATYGGSSGSITYKSDLIINGTMIVDGILNDNGDTNIDGGALIVNGSVVKRNNLNGSNANIEINGTFTNEVKNSGNAAEKDGNIKIVSGKLNVTSTGKLYNKSSLNCMGSFVNEGTFYDYVGSVYGGVPYTSNGSYACYVNSAQRLSEAYNRLNIYAKDKTQKIILQAGSYDLRDSRAKNIIFENDGDVTLKNSVATSAIMRIKGLNVVDGTVTVNNDMMINNDITIAKDQKIVFENNYNIYVNNSIINNGTFDLKAASDSNNLPANVYCKSADVTKGTWTNYPLVISDGSFWNQENWDK